MINPTDISGLQREIDFYAIARHKNNISDIKQFLKAVRSKFKDDEIKELLQGFKVKTINEKIYVYSLQTKNWYILGDK